MSSQPDKQNGGRKVARWKIIAGAVGVVLVIGIIAAAIGGGDDEAEPVAADTPATTTAATPAPAPETTTAATPPKPAPAPEPQRPRPGPGDRDQAQRLADGFLRMAAVSEKAEDCGDQDLVCSLSLIDEMAAAGERNLAEARAGMSSATFPCVRRVSRDYIQIMGAFSQLSSADPLGAIEQMSAQQAAMSSLVVRAQECTSQIRAAS